jgi:hypothetical protein
LITGGERVIAWVVMTRIVLIVPHLHKPFLRNVYGVDVPRTAQEQYDFSTHINDADIQEGDLVFFKSGHSISHVGLYVGNNKICAFFNKRRCYNY